MASETNTSDQNLRDALKIVATGLNGRKQMEPEEIEALQRELQSLATDGRVLLTSAEQLKAENIIGFMFRPTVEECLQLWFGKSRQTDTEIWSKFGADVALASEGGYDHWALNPEHPRMLLALILLLDQFRRNMYRNSPEMYAQDTRCVGLVKRAITHGVTERLKVLERVFTCLVLTHSEQLSDQHLCMQEWEKVELELAPTDPLRVFHEVFSRHLLVIERFNCFPHRNSLLGRESSPEEEAFLTDTEFRFDLPLVQLQDGRFCFQGTINGREVARIEGEKVSLVYQGPDAAMAQAEEEIRLRGYALVGDIKLHKFIVERDMPAIGSIEHSQMQKYVNKSNRALRQLWPRMTWIESYVCNDKMFCVYLADQPGTLREHALMADMPLNAAHRVRSIVDAGSYDDDG